MPSLLLLEEFKPKPFVGTGRHDPDRTKTAIDTDQIEALKVNAYDSGYQAGWDDSSLSHANDQDSVGSDLAKNLQDLEFTFHEARIQVMKALQPLLLDMINKVLPELVAQSFGQTLLEELLVFAESAIDQPIELVVAPSNEQLITALLSSAKSVGAKVISEPSLGDGQAFLRAGKTESHIDLDTSIGQIGKSIQAIYQINSKELRHG